MMDGGRNEVSLLGKGRGFARENGGCLSLRSRRFVKNEAKFAVRALSWG